MPRLFISNFDFEHQLAEPMRSRSHLRIELNRQLAWSWLGVADDNDSLWMSSSVSEPVFPESRQFGLPDLKFLSQQNAPLADHELCPWGWTQEILDWGRQQGLRCPAPPLEIVRQVNSRLFSIALENEWGVGLPGAGALYSLADLPAAFDRLPAGNSPWVIKSWFGMSGRERIMGRGANLSEAQTGWLSRRLQRDGGVVFEPWVESVSEAGLQFDVPQNGTPVLVGIVPLLSTPHGGYEGSLLEPRDSLRVEWKTAVETGLQAAARIQALGYFGPLGIDAMFYHAGETIACRPLQDINARWTMGRVALGCSRLLCPGELGAWLRLPLTPVRRLELWQAGDCLTRLQADMPDGTRVIPTSPFWRSESDCTHATVLVTGASAANRETAVTRLRDWIRVASSPV